MFLCFLKLSKSDTKFFFKLLAPTLTNHCIICNVIINMFVICKPFNTCVMNRMFDVIKNKTLPEHICIFC